MTLLGRALALVAFTAWAAAVAVMLRSPKTASRSERAIWVAVVFLLPILGPLLYLNHKNPQAGA